MTTPDLIFDLVRRAREGGIQYREVLDLARRAYIAGALERNSGNIGRAARDMRVHRNTLSRQMAMLGIGRRVPGAA